MKTGQIILIALIVSLLQIGCSSEANIRSTDTSKDNNPDIRDGGFLSAEPCGPPCFFDIIPGITTKDQAISLLKARDLYSECHEYDNRRQGGVRGIACQNISIGYRSDSDIVENIGFKPTQPITVEDAIAKYGEPNAVLVTDVGYTQNDFVLNMIIYFDVMNVELVLAEQNSGTFELTPVTSVENIGYSDESSYRQSREHSQNWKGYDIYDLWNP